MLSENRILKQREKDLLKFIETLEQKFKVLEEKHVESEVKLTEKAAGKHIEALYKAIETLNIAAADVSNLLCKYVCN